MQEQFRKLSTLSNLFREERMPRMAGPEAPQELPKDTRKAPPDVPLREKGKDLVQRGMDDMEEMSRKDDAERTLKDTTKAEKLVNYMLSMLTDKNVEQRRSLDFKGKAQDIVKLAQDPKFHDLLVDCAIAREHGDDPQRREAATALVNALSQDGALDQAFVAQLEKANVTDKGQPVMMAGGKRVRK